jgi:phosphoglycolate phosphatase-like HAD superfamily hydrolase
MLILFDIDATLITTSGVGIRAMTDAGRELYGPGFKVEGIEFAGRLDPLIIMDMFRASGVPVIPESLFRFRAAYERHLRRRIVEPTTVARALPGVHQLVDALEKIDGVTLGLLTGNFAETGAIKLRHCGLEPDRFPLQVWGDESRSSPPRREDLPGVAIKRYHERYQRPIESARTVVIGDTPHDIRCAKEHQCRSLAVATGSFGMETLASHTPDLVVQDLTETDVLVRWLTTHHS